MHYHSYEHEIKRFCKLIEERGYGNTFLLDKLDVGIVRTGTLAHCLKEFFSLYEDRGKTDASLQLETQLTFEDPLDNIHCIFKARFEECSVVAVNEIILRRLATGDSFIVPVLNGEAIPDAAAVMAMFCKPEHKQIPRAETAR